MPHPASVPARRLRRICGPAQRRTRSPTCSPNTDHRDPSRARELHPLAAPPVPEDPVRGRRAFARPWDSRRTGAGANRFAALPVSTDDPLLRSRPLCRATAPVPRAPAFRAGPRPHLRRLPPGQRGDGPPGSRVPRRRRRRADRGGRRERDHPNSPLAAAGRHARLDLIRRRLDVAGCKDGREGPERPGT